MALRDRGKNARECLTLSNRRETSHRTSGVGHRRRAGETSFGERGSTDELNVNTDRGRLRMEDSSGDIRGSGESSERSRLAREKWAPHLDQLESSEELLDLVEDKEIAARAVAFVVNSSRKGVVTLCADVASLMHANRRLEKSVTRLKRELVLLRSASGPGTSLCVEQETGLHGGPGGEERRRSETERGGPEGLLDGLSLSSRSMSQRDSFVDPSHVTVFSQLDALELTRVVSLTQSDSSGCSCSGDTDISSPPRSTTGVTIPAPPLPPTRSALRRTTALPPRGHDAPRGHDPSWGHPPTNHDPGDVVVNVMVHRSSDGDSQIGKTAEKPADRRKNGAEKSARKEDGAGFSDDCGESPGRAIMRDDEGEFRCMVCDDAQLQRDGKKSEQACLQRGKKLRGAVEPAKLDDGGGEVVAGKEKHDSGSRSKGEEFRGSEAESQRSRQSEAGSQRSRPLEVGSQRSGTSEAGSQRSGGGSERPVSRPLHRSKAVHRGETIGVVDGLVGEEEDAEPASRTTRPADLSIGYVV